MNRLSINDVYRLCNEKQYFGYGTNEQYTKMFDMVREDKPIHDIAVAIWICSGDIDLREVEDSLIEISRGTINDFTIRPSGRNSGSMGLYRRLGDNRYSEVYTGTYMECQEEREMLAVL